MENPTTVNRDPQHGGFLISIFIPFLLYPLVAKVK
jgi:hypothetical protein